MEQSNFSLKAQRLSSHKFSLLQHIWSLEVGKVKLHLDRIALSARTLISIGGHVSKNNYDYNIWKLKLCWELLTVNTENPLTTEKFVIQFIFFYFFYFFLFMNLFLMNFFFRWTFNPLFKPLIYCSALFCLVE